MLHRPSFCRIDTAAIARSSRALLAVSLTASVYVQSTTVPAIADESQSSDAYLADLVNQASEKQQQVDTLRNEMGGLREATNKSRVDLTRAQSQAQEAQDRAVKAREQLGSADKDVSQAQEKLDDIARSAYKQGGSASPVTLAAGEDAAADSLDRASYIRMATERQQSTVDQLDLARTQSANEDSRLRTSREDADQAVQKAAEAHQRANDAFASSQQRLQTLSADVKRITQEHDNTLRKLKAAKAAIDALANQKPDATSFDKRKAAESAVTKAEKPATAPAIANYAGEVNQEESAEDAEDSAPTSNNQPPAEPEAAPEIAEYAEQAQPAPEAPVGSVEEMPAPAIELPEMPAEFEGSVAGDEQRQQAIDGLVEAGGAALSAGLEAHANGNPEGSLDAAMTAGRETAGARYDAIVGENPAQEAEQQGVLVDPETGLQENVPGEMAPVTPPENDNLPPAANGVDTSGTVEQKIERVIDRGMSQLGVQYAWGGGDANGPTLGIRDGGVADSYGDYAKIGFDCSGLTLYAFAAVGIQLDHYTGYQYQAGRQIPSSEMQRGDLLFWGPGASQHVAIYLGDGQMLEAPQSGDVVKVSPVRYAGMTPNAVRLIE